MGCHIVMHYGHSKCMTARGAYCKMYITSCRKKQFYVIKIYESGRITQYIIQLLEDQ